MSMVASIKPECQHKWRFLREESSSHAFLTTGRGIFFCQRCLDVRIVELVKEEQ